MKPLLSLLLLLLLLSLSQLTNSTEYQYPFIPPLTHTPQMSLSTIGSPSPPAHALLADIETISQNPCARCQALRHHIQQEAEKGNALRLQLQEQLSTLLRSLPPDFPKQALQNRANNSENIGEIKLWEQLSQQD